MGFGLCAFGYVFLILDVLGLDFVGYLLLATGFKRIYSELKNNKGFSLAFYACAGLCLTGALNLVNFTLTALELFETPLWLAKGITVLYVLLSVVLHFCYIGEVNRIVSGGGATKFAFYAKLVLYVSALYFAALMAQTFFAADNAFTVAVMIGKYVVILLNVILLFMCFTTITTQARFEEEQEIIEMETEILERKRFLKEQKKKKREGNTEGDD